LTTLPALNAKLLCL